MSGSARIGAATVDLDGAVAYAEKNWGAGGMPPAWWWGQAARLRLAPTCASPSPAVSPGSGRCGPRRALVVAVGDELRTVVRPPRPLRITVDERGWRLAGGGIEVEAHAAGAAHLLPVPVPGERRRLDDWAPQQLAGTLRLSVRRRGRTLYQGTSELAGLERGRGHLG